jgi:hypothetical protein
MKIKYLNKDWTIHYCRPFNNDKRFLEICLVDSKGKEIDYTELPAPLKKKVYWMAFDAAEDDDWGGELAHGDFLADCYRDNSW